MAAIKSEKEKLARIRETIARKLDSTEKQKMELDDERERLRTQIHSIEKGILKQQLRFSVAVQGTSHRSISHSSNTLIHVLTRAAVLCRDGAAAKASRSGQEGGRGPHARPRPPQEGGDARAAVRRQADEPREDARAEHPVRANSKN